MKHLFILHRRPLRESRLLLDIWSREDGRQQMVIRERPETIYEPGQTYRADWRDAEEWPEAFAFHCETVRHFNGDALACLLYLNELIVNLVPRQERQSQLFDYYQLVLDALAQASDNGLNRESVSTSFEPWLRGFEYRLLTESGYGFSWSQTIDSKAVDQQRYYGFDPQTGFSEQSDGWPGSWLLAIESGQNTTIDCWRMARKVLAQAIDSRLDHPLISRQLVRSPALTLTSNLTNQC